MDRKKILSGITMVVIVIPLLLFLPLNFLSLAISIIVSLSIWEFFKLRFSSEISLGLSLLLFFFLISFSLGIGLQLSISVIGLITWMILGILILGFPHNKNILQNIFFWFFSGFFIHVSFFSSFFLLASYPNPLSESTGIELSSRGTLILLITISALMDSLAYFGGLKFGKRKFLPNVSPNKTLEGFLIAVLSTPLIVMPILALFYKYNFFKVFILIFLVSIFSVLGDATASLFKRISGVKDSSNIIPGHGGFFDRLDSHLAAAPCFVLLIYFMRGF